MQRSLSLGLELLSLVCVFFIGNCSIAAGEFEIDGYRFTLPEGFIIEKIVDPSIVARPISASFDEAGNLYVTESSGTNDPSKKQLEDKPHRVLRLTDSDGDGFFDKRTVYADKLMFPEGAMFYHGSLYVAAPPSIWKFTDTDADGVADKREEWLDAKTLTGCANDLHGPYLGPDGWLYWCKGAFAEQTYERPGKKPLVTRASHIFRRRPEGGVIESVMTGGMDNPVEVAFSSAGERFFTTTFLQHPSNGKRDGIIHAVYGGVYGKDHGVLQGHPRTGDLMPPLVHLGAAAPSGLMTMNSDQFGTEIVGNLFASTFNMHKVTRHQLIRDQGTFKTIDEDFLVCDSFDFHPTDVLEDADGSLLVIDTGGWYKLCCPTSQLYKPEILGSIYRISERQNAHGISDPRGKEIDWSKLDTDELSRLLGDSRSAVRFRAQQMLIKSGADSFDSLYKHFEQALLREDIPHQQAIIWAASQIDSSITIELCRRALSATEPEVKIVAAHCVGLHRDKQAFDQLCEMLNDESPAVRRAAAEALGRLGKKDAVQPLLAALKPGDSRTLQHALTYALIEIGDAKVLAEKMKNADSTEVAAALIALDQMESGNLDPEVIARCFNDSHENVRRAAFWVAMQHDDWGDHFRDALIDRAEKEKSSDEELTQLRQLLTKFAHSASGQSIVMEVLKSSSTAVAKRNVLEAMRDCKLETAPEIWIAASKELSGKDEDVILAAGKFFQKYRFTSEQQPALTKSLLAVANNGELKYETRLTALSAVSGELKLSADLFELVQTNIAAGNNLTNRNLAAQILASAKLNNEQLIALTDMTPQVGPLEIEQVLTAFQQTTDSSIAEHLTESLKKTSAIASIEQDKLLKLVSHFGTETEQKIKDHLQALSIADQDQLNAMNQRLAKLPTGDAVAGQKIFMSPTAACAACHAVGYLGGKLGPDLTRIGNIRQQRDLMESILYPSASFVRGFEPVIATTFDGKTISGFLREDNEREIVLVTSDRKEIRVAREDIEELGPGTVSIMPAGLDKQLTDQQLADLLEFLKTAR